MKKTLLFLVAVIFLWVVQVYGQATIVNVKSNFETVNTSDELSESQQARQDSITEYQKFKKEAEEKIIAYEKIISEFKIKIAKEKKENKVIYEKKLAELEQKNSDMKKKLDDYKEVGEDKWESFKTNFDKDMDELGKAFNNLFD